MEALLGRNLTWVLSRLRLEVERHPGAGETVTVQTRPSSRGGICATLARLRTRWA